MERKKRTTPRKREYGLEVERVVVVVWESLDYVCAQRLKLALLPTAHHLAGFGELALAPRGEGQLAAISESTLERMLGRLRRPRTPAAAQGTAGGQPAQAGSADGEDAVGHGGAGALRDGPCASLGGIRIGGVRAYAPDGGRGDGVE